MNFQIETTNYCNLSCVECPHRLMKRKKEVMAEEVFAKILYDYIMPFKDKNLSKGHNPTLILHKDGEPLINPSLRKFMRMVAVEDKFMKMDIYTNGLLLTRDFIDFLGTLPNPMWLLVSFHFYNYDGSENDYSKTNDLLHEVLKTNKPKNVHFIFVSHITRFMSLERLEMWKSSWEKSFKPGTFAIHINSNINPWTGLINEPNCVKFHGCPYADFGHMFFGVSGNIIPCCMDLEEQIVFGNVMTDNPREKVAELEYFYDKLNKKEFLPYLCKKCMED